MTAARLAAGIVREAGDTSRLTSPADHPRRVRNAFMALARAAMAAVLPGAGAKERGAIEPCAKKLRVALVDAHKNACE